MKFLFDIFLWTFGTARVNPHGLFFHVSGKPLDRAVFTHPNITYSDVTSHDQSASFDSFIGTSPMAYNKRWLRNCDLGTNNPR